ncbi:MAG: ABC transporter ATP-binding protein [Saprospiraceae bacterium]|nr:ABC transporter ATP-binding protein [Saprospiraceae bacterium]
MPQNPLLALNPTMTCGSQVAEVITGRRKEKKAIVLDLFEKVYLTKPEKLYYAYPNQVSLGQLQRVSLAMALAAKPQLLLVDEPFSSLDATNAYLLSSLFRDLSRQQKITFLMITHDLKVTETLADCWIWMENGAILLEGSGSIIQMQDLPIEIGQVVRSASLVNDHKPKLNPGTEALLSLSNVGYRYERRKRLSIRKKEPSRAISGINLTIYRHHVLGLVGQSGSGKSTLAKIIGGLIIDFEGQLKRHFVENRPYFKHVQYIMQDPASSLPPLRSVGDIILDTIAAYFTEIGKRDRLLLLQKVLKDVGLSDDYRSKFRYQLSGGEKQRIILARALVVRPEILVLDESLSALDRYMQFEILHLLEDLMNNYKLSIVLVSHDLDLVENFCQTLIYLEEGRIRFVGKSNDPAFQTLKESKNILH